MTVKLIPLSKDEAKQAILEKKLYVLSTLRGLAINGDNFGVQCWLPHETLSACVPVKGTDPQEQMISFIDWARKHPTKEFI